MEGYIYEEPDPPGKIISEALKLLRSFTRPYPQQQMKLDFDLYQFTHNVLTMTSIDCLILDMLDKRSFFAKTVDHLARCLAAIKPTPWEKA
jgi:hypothetical protein